MEWFNAQSFLTGLSFAFLLVSFTADKQMLIARNPKLSGPQLVLAYAVMASLFGIKWALSVLSDRPEEYVPSGLIFLFFLRMFWINFRHWRSVSKLQTG